MWFLPRTISTRHKGVHLLVKENFSDIIGSASWAGPKCTGCSTCENSWSSIHMICALSWYKIYCNKQFTDRKYPTIRPPMRRKTALRSRKVCKATLILSFFLFEACCHVTFKVISMWLFPSVITKPKHLQESWHWLLSLH